MTPKLLFVDDRWPRMQSALRQYDVHYTLGNGERKIYEVTLAPSVKEVLRAIVREDFDILSLDHDLSGCDFEDPDSSQAGMEIVRYIAKTGWPKEKKKPEIWIHSTNLFVAHSLAVRFIALGFSTIQKKFKFDLDEKGNPNP